MLAFKALKGMAPPYLQSLIEPYNPRLALKSANKGMLTEPLLKDNDLLVLDSALKFCL